MLIYSLKPCTLAGREKPVLPRAAEYQPRRAPSPPLCLTRFSRVWPPISNNAGETGIEFAESVWEISRISGRSKAAPSLKMAMQSRRSESWGGLMSSGRIVPITAFLLSPVAVGI